MRVEHKPPEFTVEPQGLVLWVPYEQHLAMALSPGWLEAGQRRSEMKKINFGAGEMAVCPRSGEVWLGPHRLESMVLTISDRALRAANDGISADVELKLRVVDKFADARLGALAAAVNSERVAGFPSGRLFLDSIEQALAIALVNNYAVRRPSARIYRGGLTPARLRRVVELVHAEMEGDLSLEELADAAGLSIAHFSQMFRQSTGQSPHQFVLHRRIDRLRNCCVPQRCASWMWRWPAGSRASSTLRASSAVCAEPALQNTGRNLRTEASRRFERSLVSLLVAPILCSIRQDHSRLED
jgi:AraC family transcriptional regulator